MASPRAFQPRNEASVFRKGDILSVPASVSVRDLNLGTSKALRCFFSKSRIRQSATFAHFTLPLRCKKRRIFCSLARGENFRLCRRTAWATPIVRPQNCARGVDMTIACFGYRAGVAARGRARSTAYIFPTLRRRQADADVAPSAQLSGQIECAQRRVRMMFLPSRKRTVATGSNGSIWTWLRLAQIQATSGP